MYNCTLLDGIMKLIDRALALSIYYPWVLIKERPLLKGLGDLQPQQCVAIGDTAATTPKCSTGEHTLSWTARTDQAIAGRTDQP